jgi:hypothetical protein
MRLTDFEPRRLNELSPATLASYKKKAGAAATAADAAGDTKTGNKRFSGIVKATKKQFDQDAKGVAEATGDEKFDKSMRQMTGKITPDDAAEMWPTQEFEPLNLDPSYFPMMEKYKAKLFPLAYQYWTEGDNADELRALGWEPDYGDDYVMVVLSGIGHDGHIQYDKYDFDAEGEDENITEDSLASMKRLAGIANTNNTNEAATPAQMAADQARLQAGNQPAAAKPAPAAPAAPTTPAAPAAAKPAPATPAAPAAAPVAAAAPAAVDPVQQKADQMQQSLLDRMGKRFGLPAGSTAEQVQAAQQDYLNKNDPAAAAQYKQNMANIAAGGSQSDNKPVQLAPTAAPAKPQQSADWQAGLAAQKAGGSPIAMMLAQPTIAGNQAMLDNIAKPLGLPAGSTAAEILAADAKQPSAKQQGIDSLAADQGAAPGTSVEQMAVDNLAKMAGLPAGMTQDEMMAAYQKKIQASKAAPAAAAPAPVAEDALAGMKRLAGIAPVQTQTIPGQRQYRHMPTAVQPR